MPHTIVNKIEQNKKRISTEYGVLFAGHLSDDDILHCSDEELLEKYKQWCSSLQRITPGMTIDNSDMNNRVNHPDYYNQGPIIRLPDGQLIRVECIDIIRDMPTWKGNAIKYLWRCGLKKEQGLDDIEKEIEDIEKSIWFLKDKVTQLKASRNGNK